MKISVLHKLIQASQVADSMFSVAKMVTSVKTADALFSVAADRLMSDITIHFDPDGGIAEFDEKTCTIGYELGDLPAASRNDDYFEGWMAENGNIVDHYLSAFQEVAYLTATYTPATEITFDANGGTVIGQSTMRMYSGHPVYESPDQMPSAQSNEAGMSFIGWYTDPVDGIKVNLNTYYDLSFTILYAHYSAKSYEVNLNNLWYLMTGGSTDPNGNSSPHLSNPDSTVYDGVYASYSNYHVANGWAKMRITFNGYDTFTFYIRSYAESSYDYVVAGKLDLNITSLPSYSTGQYHTRAKLQSGQAIRNYTACTYSTDGGSHFIDVVYRKDGSANSSNDRGYVLIPKD